MFKYFAVLAIAIAAASATTKEEEMEKLNKIVSELGFSLDASRLVLSTNLDSIKASDPASADCVDEISKEPLEKFDEYFSAALEQMRETAAALKEELSAIEDSDEEALDAISEKIDPYGTTFDVNAAFSNAFKNSFDAEFLADAKAKCNCEAIGWCSVFEM